MKTSLLRRAIAAMLATFSGWSQGMVFSIGINDAGPAIFMPGQIQQGDLARLRSSSGCASFEMASRLVKLDSLDGRVDEAFHLGRVVGDADALGFQEKQPSAYPTQSS